MRAQFGIAEEGINARVLAIKELPVHPFKIQRQPERAQFAAQPQQRQADRPDRPSYSSQTRYAHKPCRSLHQPTSHQTICPGHPSFLCDPVIRTAPSATLLLVLLGSPCVSIGTGVHIELGPCRTLCRSPKLWILRLYPPTLTHAGSLGKRNRHSLLPVRHLLPAG